jgi:hypothetical protein
VDAAVNTLCGEKLKSSITMAAEAIDEVVPMIKVVTKANDEGDFLFMVMRFPRSG